MKKIFGLLLFVAVLGGCGKDDDPKLTVEQYLTASTNGWVFESILVKDPDTGIEVNLVSISEFFEACDLDDATIFTADGKYTVANNTKCDPDDDAQLDAGTWTLNTDKTTLSVVSTVDGPLFTFTKLEVNDTNIKGEVSDLFGTGGSDALAAKITMKKK